MLNDSYMFGLAHELIFTAKVNQEGKIDRDRLVKEVQDQLIAAQKNGYNEGRKEAAQDIRTGMNELLDEFE